MKKKNENSLIEVQNVIVQVFIFSYFLYILTTAYNYPLKIKTLYIYPCSINFRPKLYKFIIGKFLWDI